MYNVDFAHRNTILELVYQSCVIFISFVLVSSCFSLYFTSALLPRTEPTHDVSDMSKTPRLTRSRVKSYERTGSMATRWAYLGQYTYVYLPRDSETQTERELEIQGSDTVWDRLPYIRHFPSVHWPVYSHHVNRVSLRGALSSHSYWATHSFCSATCGAQVELRLIGANALIKYYVRFLSLLLKGSFATSKLEFFDFCFDLWHSLAVGTT